MPPLLRTTLIGLAAAAAVAPAPATSVTADSIPPDDTALASPTDDSLLPAPPAELGAPAVAPPAASTGESPVDLATALDPYHDFGTDAAPGEFPRTVRHAMGATEIAARPERVVVLDVGELDAMVMLGLTPVGAVEYNLYGLPPFILEQVGDVELVGTVQELNLEAIAALDPDLIISSKLRHESEYATLSQIAPTVFAERPGVSFKQNFGLYAQAIGREAEAAEVVARYEATVRETNAVLPAERPSVSIVQLRPDGVRVYLTANFLGVVLADLGFPRGEGGNIDDFAFDISTELLADHVDGDVLILAVVDEDENEFAQEILNGPVWPSLPAVSAGNVFEVDSRTWIGGVGYGAAFEVLDGLTAIFASADTTAPDG